MYKKGDKLLCIEGYGFLVVGNVYTFNKFGSLQGRLSVEESDSDWFITRFVLATPLMEALW